MAGEILRALFAGLAQLGVAFHAGIRTAQNTQAEADKDKAREALEERSQVGNGDRDDLTDRLRETGRLRDD